MAILLRMIGAGALLGMGGFAVVSWREGERRASLLAIVIASIVAGLYLGVGFFAFAGREALGWGLIGLPFLASGVLLWPRSARIEYDHREPTARVDECDTMFSRRELVPRTQRYEDYYRAHPELLAVDEAWRKKPGLLSPGTRYFHREAFAAADASFLAVDELHGLVEDPQEGENSAAAVDGKPSREEDEGRESTTGIARPEGAPDRNASAEDTRFLCSWAKKLGAVSCGVTELREAHFYTVGGRRERYGLPIHSTHTHALAFTVEMDHRMMLSSPDASTVMESAQQYFNAGAIAVQLAVAIRKLGFSARAHIDANYQVICPLVARDAGLGEIGRMGLLMTPRLGPRVRIGVVTTDLPLHVTPRREDPAIEDFCSICKKCAVVCPSQAISREDAKEQGGVRRWRIDPEACFSYWCDSGTDCGRCVSTCPFSHPDQFYHNLIRWGIRRSPLFRQLALRLDDLFYGRKPRPRKLPIWLGSH